MPRRGTTTARRYGTAHQHVREEWRPAVEAGQVECFAEICLRSSRQIVPGEPWHLGHDKTGTMWTGPEHVKCNTTEGAIRGNAMRRPKVALPFRRSRRW
jgi:hypothetical protein